MNERLLSSVSQNLLFRYSIPLLSTDAKWSKKSLNLDERHRLPHFGSFEQQQTFADCRAGWNDQGLFFQFDIRGKRQPLNCQLTRALQSDGVQIWIDTRNVQSIHRASRFCHWFVFLPIGGEDSKKSPFGTMLRINRAKEDAKTFQMFKPLVASDVAKDGYRLSLCIPGNSLTGWNPADQPRLGFNYAVIDSELGWQTLATDFRFPIAENPSLWHTLELTAAS